MLNPTQVKTNSKSILFLEDLNAMLLNEIEDIIYEATPGTYNLIYVNNAF